MVSLTDQAITLFYNCLSKVSEQYKVPYILAVIICYNGIIFFCDIFAHVG